MEGMAGLSSRGGGLHCVLVCQGAGRRAALWWHVAAATTQRRFTPRFTPVATIALKRSAGCRRLPRGTSSVRHLVFAHQAG